MRVLCQAMYTSYCSEKCIFLQEKELFAKASSITARRCAANSHTHLLTLSLTRTHTHTTGNQTRQVRARSLNMVAGAFTVRMLTFLNAHTNKESSCLQPTQAHKAATQTKQNEGKCIFAAHTCLQAPYTYYSRISRAHEPASAEFRTHAHTHSLSHAHKSNKQTRMGSSSSMCLHTISHQAQDSANCVTISPWCSPTFT
jgi:hypothetical protein